jgi:hypothetical protein
MLLFYFIKIWCWTHETYTKDISKQGIGLQANNLSSRNLWSIPWRWCYIAAANRMDQPPSHQSLCSQREIYYSPPQMCSCLSAPIINKSLRRLDRGRCINIHNTVFAVAITSSTRFMPYSNSVRSSVHKELHYNEWRKTSQFLTARTVNIRNELKYPALLGIQDKVKIQKYTEYTENT